MSRLAQKTIGSIVKVLGLL